MSNREKLVRGGIQLLGGHAAVQFLSLARNFCIARLISPEDFGVAATFALTLSMLEAIGDLSFHKLLIQDPEGEDPTLQAVLQSLTLIRGLLIGAAIFAASEPIARIFGVPEAADAYRWLALAPVLKGFVHLDIYRLQRSLSFSVEVRLLVLAQATAFVVAVGLAWLWRDYMAVLWAVIAQAAVQGLGAHILAERSYQLRLQGAQSAKAFHFGWPLMLNGFVIMLATQGDRALVGAQLTMADLAVYTVAALLVSALQLPILKVTATLTLPWLAAVQGDALFTRRYEMTSDALAVLALLVFLPLTLLGAQLMVLVFGVEYRAPATLVGWLAFGAALRVLRGGPVIGSFAVGNTKNLMLSNLVRSAGIFVAALALFLEGGLAAVAAAMCLGELAAYGLAMIRLGHIVDVPIAVRVRGLAVVVATFLLALAFEAGLPRDAFFLKAVLALTITAAGVVVILRSSPQLLTLVRTHFSGKGRLA